MKARFTYHHQYNTIRVSFPKEQGKGFKKITMPMSLKFHNYLVRAYTNTDDQGAPIDPDELTYQQVAEIYHETMKDLAGGRFNLKPHQFWCRTLGLPQSCPDLDAFVTTSSKDS